ncbi:MAG TPA: ABC transporter ATP-binding protein [Streptosporangiaceae bacterium]
MSVELDRTAGGGTALSGSALLDVRDLRVEFHRGGDSVLAVNGVSFTAWPGRTLAIVGESGSGKTVTCRAVMGLLPPTAEVTGSAKFDGTELLGLADRHLRRHRGANLAMVFQDPARSLNPTMRVGAQVTEAIRSHLPLGRKEARERAIELMKLVRIPLPERRFGDYPHQFSGGMRQRLMIAIALACHPRLLIADEATTSLDVTTQAQIMELLLDLQAELGMGLILISHDLGLAASYTDDVIVMYAGGIVEQAPTRRLFAHVRMPYTKALLDAVPRLERQPHSPLPVVGGHPASASAAPAGCSFAPRCPSARDRCHTEPPPLAEQAPGHRWACWFPCEDGGHA